MAELAGFARRHRWPLIVGLGLLLLVAYHTIWLLRIRDGFAVDIDEAGYLNIAFNNLDGLHANGLVGLWDSYAQQGQNAPLVPLLAVPFLQFREGILPAFGVEWAAFLILGSATYALARSLLEPPWAALATLTVVALPGVMNYTREFSFALPCAAAFTVALLALVRSRHLTSLPLALVWGGAAGLAALSRTMALGLLPGLMLAAVLWAALAPPGERRRAGLNLTAGVFAGLAVAGTWYIRNLGSVLDYLTGFGYGNEASPYGVEHPFLSLDRWTQALYTMSWQELFVPLLYLGTAIFLIGLGFGIRRMLRPGRRQWLVPKLKSPAMPLTVFVICGYVALSSTANQGTAFALPILPAGLILTVALAARFPHRGLRTVTVIALTMVALVQLLSFAQIGGPAEKIRNSEVPLLGPVPVTDPRAPVVGLTSNVPGELRFTEADEGWLDTGVELSRKINAKAVAEGRTPVVGVGNRDIVLNTNLITFAARLATEPQFPLAQLSPSNGGDTVAAYEEFLSDPVFGQPNVLVTSGNEFRDLEPVATQSKVVTAARRTGFEPFTRIIQPNGEKLTLWWIDRGPAIPSPPSYPAPANEKNGQSK